MASKEEEEAIVERWKEYFNGPATPVEFPDSPYFAPQGSGAGLMGGVSGGVDSRLGRTPPPARGRPPMPTVQVRVNDKLNELVPILDSIDAMGISLTPDYVENHNHKLLGRFILTMVITFPFLVGILVMAFTWT